MTTRPPPSLVLHDGLAPMLAPTIGAELIQTSCRDAGLAFLDGARAGWGKRELATWLMETYGPICAPLSDDELAAPTPTAATSVREQSVGELVELVAVAVTSALADLARGDTSVVATIVRERAVVAAQGATRLVWVPADRPRLRLELRVLSLFAVDFLLRPESYATELSVCAHCDAVSFDGAGRSCQRCDERGRPSHIRATEGAPGLIDETLKSAG